jgi:hypothetical protein
MPPPQQPQVVTRQQLDKKIYLLEPVAAGERQDKLPVTMTLLSSSRWTSEPEGVGAVPLFTLYSHEHAAKLHRAVAVMQQLAHLRRR